MEEEAGKSTYHLIKDLGDGAPVWLALTMFAGGILLSIAKNKGDEINEIPALRAIFILVALAIFISLGFFIVCLISNYSSK